MVSSLSQNDRDNRDFSSILEGPWRVTDELNELVQYAPLIQFDSVGTGRSLMWKMWTVVLEEIGSTVTFYHPE